MNKIEIKNITKTYKDVTALNDVSVEFDYGKIYALLGRNGAGKSTLINIIAKRLFEDSGSILIDGLPNKENIQVRELIFCMSESDLFDEAFKVKELFKWINCFYDSFDIDKAYEIAKRFNLNTNKKISTLSRGYKSIYKLTIALSLNVPYIIYDEPVLGLDANHRELFYELLLKDYSETTKTVIIATHLIEEISNIVEDVVLIDNGKILLNKNVEELLEMGYSVSGIASEVDEYCLDKNVIGSDDLGALKVAYILGNKTKSNNDRLQFSKINLQKLFVKLTEKGDIYE